MDLCLLIIEPMYLCPELCHMSYNDLRHDKERYTRAVLCYSFDR